MALLGLGLAFVLHIFINYTAFTNRIIYIDDLTAWDKAMAVLTVVLVLDATRRVIGWALPVTALVFLAYAVFLSGIKMQVLLEQSPSYYRTLTHKLHWAGSLTATEPSHN